MLSWHVVNDNRCQGDFMSQLLLVFLVFRLVQHVFEQYLSFINRRYYMDERRRTEAAKLLGISAEQMQKTVAYSTDKYFFARRESWFMIAVTLIFIGAGGLGWLESVAISLAATWGGTEGSVSTGLVFFGFMFVASSLVQLPFDWQRTFRLEERHGFNRQTPKIFILDRLKGLLLFLALGAPLLSLILWIMGAAGPNWWILAWIVLSGFSILTAWLYPTFLAPLFNKFSPLPDGSLKDKIMALADRVQFHAAGLSVMDASKRSSHGNAYFTGVFGKKKIVLFDTLVESMSDDEVVAVLTHELGHFKLHHVRWGLIRSLLMTGATFYLLSLFLPMTEFYTAFGLSGVSSYGALTAFSLWFGMISFFIGPLETYLSRRNEFAADAFALKHVGNNKDLGHALLKLREKSHSMPLAHPLFSSIYYSHPPMLERLQAMGFHSA